jgi:hypothetical protein
MLAILAARVCYNQLVVYSERFFYFPHRPSIGAGAPHPDLTTCGAGDARAISKGMLDEAPTPIELSVEADVSRGESADTLETVGD